MTSPAASRPLTPLHRLLRALATEDVLVERADGRFDLAPAGHLLRVDVPGSLRPLIVARGALYAPAVQALPDSVRDGGVPFDRVYGRSFFDHLSQRAEHASTFHASMANRSRREAESLLSAGDFPRFRHVVDVGGGSGTLISAVVERTTGATGLLFDLPSVVARARVPARVEVIGGNFLDRIPGGGDAYVLSRILHDWDDETAALILRRCREAMHPGSVLLIAEAVLPEHAADDPEVVRRDVSMMVLTSGRERSRRDFAAILGAAGFELSRVIATTSPSGVALLEAVPVTCQREVRARSECPLEP